MMELVTVIIPTFNRGHIIGKAISSVLKQSYTNLELLVVDDYSEDNTKAIIEEYEDDRIKFLVNTRKKGAQGARNTGLLEAKGKWIAFLDSDDYWLKDKLKLQIKELNTKGKLFCHTNWYEKDGDRTNIQNKKKCNILKVNYIGTFSSVVINKVLTDKVGLLDENLVSCQDWDYWIRVSHYVKPIYIDLPLLVYVKYSINNISKNTSNRILGRQEIFNKYKKEIESEGLGYFHKYDLAVISSDFSLFREAFNEKKSVYQVFRYLYHTYIK
jgi:glycosyltransferase involved in cell wall biosynthesis